MILLWDPEARKQYLEAPEAERRKINKLIDAIMEHPYVGIGKPEALGGEYRDWNVWSRRVTKKHRLVYRVSAIGDEVHILQCLGHYSDH